MPSPVGPTREAMLSEAGLSQAMSPRRGDTMGLDKPASRILLALSLCGYSKAECGGVIHFHGCKEALLARQQWCHGSPCSSDSTASNPAPPTNQAVSLQSQKCQFMWDVLLPSRGHPTRHRGVIAQCHPRTSAKPTPL